MCYNLSQQGTESIFFFPVGSTKSVSDINKDARVWLVFKKSRSTRVVRAAFAL